MRRWRIVWDDRRAVYARLVGRDATLRTPGTKYAGGHRSRVTPVPIPNTEVKPATADGTAWETVWESRSLPAVIPRADVSNRVGPFCLAIGSSGQLVIETCAGRERLRPRRASAASRAAASGGGAPRAVEDVAAGSNAEGRRE